MSLLARRQPIHLHLQDGRLVPGEGIYGVRTDNVATLIRDLSIVRFRC